MKERGKGMGQEVRALVDAEADLADAVGDLRAAPQAGGLGVLGYWKREAEHLACMLGRHDSVRVWAFGAAPLAFQACSGHAGDEDWVALMKKPSANAIMVDELPRYLRDGANSVEVVHLGEWALVIGAHA